MSATTPHGSRFAASIRANVIAGVFVLAPIGAVAWIVIWLWNLLAAVADIFPGNLHPKVLLDITNPVAAGALDLLLLLLTLAFILAFVWLAGLVSRYYIGKKLLELFRGFVAHVPILKTVYTTLEQLLTTFSGSQTRSFSRVVRIEYPRKGLHTLALVTGERKGMLTVFVPTTPNPTSGFYLMIDAAEAVELAMSVEDALKEIISMGLVRKDT